MNSWKGSYSVGLLIVFATLFLPIETQSEEIPAYGPIPFTAYDRDGNGSISEAEFNTVRAERMTQKAAEGRPMRGAANAPAFSAFDTNGDGQLTQEELAAGQKAQMEKRGGMGMGMGQGRGMGRGMGQGQGRGMGRGMGQGRNMPAFSEFDLNGDGKIVEKELYTARAKRMSERAQQGYPLRNAANAPSFADIDTDGNREISPEEFAAHQAQMRQQPIQQ